MNKFILDNILRPFAGRWIKGLFLLLLWTAAFIALPAVSGWFLAMCSVVFVTANIMFAYIIPATLIRAIALVRTAARYFERVENHKTTLEAQRSLQLRIFESVARLPYFKKQQSDNPALLENSTHGVDQILNHVLLWILPLAALVVALVLYFIFLNLFSQRIAIELLISSALLLFLIPTFFYRRSREIYRKLSLYREEDNRELVQSFRGRIEISKYGLQQKVIDRYGQRLSGIERLESRLQSNSFTLQLIMGLGFSYTAAFIFWSCSGGGIDSPTAIGIFFGIMAQAELAEILFSGKSERCSVEHQIGELDALIRQGDRPADRVAVGSRLESLQCKNIIARIPETAVRTPELSLDIRKGELIALFGGTGIGKTTLLNCLFHPEYFLCGSISWNGVHLPHLPVPESIYVTQKACLLTGTLRENFEGYPDESIVEVLQTVDLGAWFASLPEGLGTWLGENGEALSGGQRKKLLLGQALLKEPQLLVVDEPTAGIGADNAIAIFRNIKARYPDMAILMATHLRDFESIADKTVNI
ncbi:MAG: ATP-binding cassette domain-containing protein [Rikenellaceae bacterium]|nr:ATP-binding cassette domain-containing protein [Rikenellaceae bacterium]